MQTLSNGFIKTPSFSRCFNTFHSFESVCLLEIQESLWQAKAVGTTRAETLFSAPLSRKPSHINFLIISSCTSENIHICSVRLKSEQKKSDLVTREFPMQGETPRICPFCIFKSGLQPELTQLFC